MEITKSEHIYELRLTEQELRLVGLALARKLPDKGEVSDRAWALNAQLLEQRKKEHQTALTNINRAEQFVKEETKKP